MRGEGYSTPARVSALPAVAAGLVAGLFAVKAAASGLGALGAAASGLAAAFALFGLAVVPLLCRHGRP